MLFVAMKVHIDGGALCAPQGRQYGNYTFSSDLLTSISEGVDNNIYTIYTFCDNSLRKKNGRVVYKKLTPSTGFMPYRVGLEELKNPCDVFLALNQAIPAHTKGKLIAFSHGLSFHLFPDLYRENHLKLENQLHIMLKKADAIIVSSEKVKQEFHDIAPSFKNVHVIPFGISLPIINTKPIKKRERVLAYVGMDHPIKQVDVICKQFLSAKEEIGDNTWRLILVGVGDSYATLHNSISVIPNLERDELNKLYQSISGLVTASLYESFNLPVLEALSNGAEVIGLQSAIIPELEKYVMCAPNENTLRLLLQEFMQGKLQKRDKLDTAQFSWEKYVQKLMTLY